MSRRRNRINKRLEKKEQDQRILDSLAELSKPVGTVPEDKFQDSTLQDLLPIRENLATTAAASTSDNCQQDSSEDSSDNSDLEGVKLNPTTVKKSATVTSLILASIPFNLNMSGFDMEMT